MYMYFLASLLSSGVRLASLLSMCKKCSMLRHFTSATDVLLEIFSYEVEDVVHRVMMLLAGIWDNHNNLNWNQKQSSSGQFCSAAVMNFP